MVVLLVVLVLVVLVGLLPLVLVVLVSVLVLLVLVVLGGWWCRASLGKLLLDGCFLSCSGWACVLGGLWWLPPAAVWAAVVRPARPPLWSAVRVGAAAAWRGGGRLARLRAAVWRLVVSNFRPLASLAASFLRRPLASLAAAD